MRPAVFFDRDGTLIEERHYVADPDLVALRPGAVDALRAARGAGLALVVVTNQSGIGRGLVSRAAYAAVAARLDTLLADAGAALDATYFCPHHPDAEPACACRKPGPAMYEQAGRDLGLDLARSAYVGDRLRDVAAAARFGGLGVLVPGAHTPPADLDAARRDFVVAPGVGVAVAHAITWARRDS